MMDLKKINLDKLQDYAFTPYELAMTEMVSNQKFINIKCLDNESLIPTVQAIPIPDNATNGDMIKAMFPYINDKPHRVQDNGNRIIIYIDMGFGWRTIEFEKDWWNAPYKRGSEE